MDRISRFDLLVRLSRANRGSAFINGKTYVAPKVPTLYSVLSTGSNASNVGIYGTNTNTFVLEKGQVIEIVLNSYDPGKHPFHLHGHDFQAVARGDDDSGPYANNVTFPQVPMRRDTFMVNPNSYIVLRFKSNNPDKSFLLLLYPALADRFYAFGFSIVTSNGTLTPALSPQ